MYEKHKAERGRKGAQRSTKYKGPQNPWRSFSISACVSFFFRSPSIVSSLRHVFFFFFAIRSPFFPLLPAEKCAEYILFLEIEMK